MGFMNPVPNLQTPISAIRMHVPTLPLISQPNLMPRGSALCLAQRISLGEQVAHGFHQDFRIGWYGASSS